MNDLITYLEDQFSRGVSLSPAERAGALNRMRAALAGMADTFDVFADQMDPAGHVPEGSPAMLNDAASRIRTVLPFLSDVEVLVLLDGGITG